MKEKIEVTNSSQNRFIIGLKPSCQEYQSNQIFQYRLGLMEIEAGGSMDLIFGFFPRDFGQLSCQFEIINFCDKIEMERATIRLFGFCIPLQIYKNQINNVRDSLMQNYVKTICEEVVQECLAEVRTSPPPKPDLEIEEVRK